MTSQLHEGRFDRIAIRLVAHLPRPIKSDPERVLINAACALIGIAGLVAVQPGSLLALLPRWEVYLWAATMLFGGVAALVGYWRDREPWARVGQVALLGGCLLYALALVLYFGSTAIFSAIIFVGIAATKAVRLLVSSADRAHVLHRADEGNP